MPSIILLPQRKQILQGSTQCLWTCYHTFQNFVEPGETSAGRGWVARLKMWTTNIQRDERGDVVEGRRRLRCSRGASCKTSSHISPRLPTDGPSARLQGLSNNYFHNFLPSDTSFRPLVKSSKRNAHQIVTATHSWTYLKNILSVFYLFIFFLHRFGDETQNDFP